MTIPSKAKLRHLFTKFYQEHDPVTLSEGFDINDLVELTTKKGVDEINRSLYQKYGCVIDFKEELEGAKAAFIRTSAGSIPSADISSKQQQYRSKLYNFFKEVDPDMISEGNEAKFGKVVHFAMLNGLDKLNEQLLQKYGEGVDINTTDVFINTSGINPFKLDMDRLKEDLKTFYMRTDISKIEFVDRLFGYACHNGINGIDIKLYHIYGTGLNEFLKETGKPVHENFEAPESRPLPVMDRPLAAIVEADDDSDVVVEVIRTPRVPREFDDMTDAEILDELEAFYKIYDEENLSKLRRTLSDCRRLGRTNIDERLLQTFGAKLTPVPAFNERTVKRKVPRPDQTIPLVPPTDIPIVSSPTGFENKNNSHLDDPFNSYENDDLEPKAAPLPPPRPPPKFVGLKKLNSF